MRSPDSISYCALFCLAIAILSGIRRAIEEEQKQPEIGVLPSTALAVGYFENFVTNVVPPLCDKRELAMKRKVKGPKGAESVERTPLAYDSFVLHIVIPDKLSEITKGSLQSNVRTLVQIAIETPFRDFPFYIRAKDYNRKPKRALSAFLGGRSVGLTTIRNNWNNGKFETSRAACGS